MYPLYSGQVEYRPAAPLSHLCMGVLLDKQVQEGIEVLKYVSIFWCQCFPSCLYPQICFKSTGLFFCKHNRGNSNSIGSDSITA